MKRTIWLALVMTAGIGLASAQNKPAEKQETLSGTPAPENSAADLLSAGSFNSQTPWEKGSINAATPPLAQANTLAKNVNSAQYEDASKKITVKLPLAWEARSLMQPGQKGVVSNFVLEGPGAPPPTCAFTGVGSDQTKKLTQAKINEVVHAEKAIDGLKAAISKSGAKIVGTKKLVVDGVNAVEATIMPKMPKDKPDLTTIITITEVPGVRWQIACTAYSAEIEQIKPEYDAVVQGIVWGK